MPTELLELKGKSVTDISAGWRQSVALTVTKLYTWGYTSVPTEGATPPSTAAAITRSGISWAHARA